MTKTELVNYILTLQDSTNEALDSTVNPADVDRLEGSLDTIALILSASENPKITRGELTEWLTQRTLEAENGWLAVKKIKEFSDTPQVNHRLNVHLGIMGAYESLLSKLVFGTPLEELPAMIDEKIHMLGQEYSELVDGLAGGYLSETNRERVKQDSYIARSTKNAYGFVKRYLERGGYHGL